MELIGRKVKVYFNLHKKKLSVQDYKSKLVIAHVDSIELEGVDFRVSQAGRARVLKEKRKNVHAFVVGTIVDVNNVLNLEANITYNPYKYASFVLIDKPNVSIIRHPKVKLFGRLIRGE